MATQALLSLSTPKTPLKSHTDDLLTQHRFAALQPATAAAKFVTEPTPVAAVVIDLAVVPPLGVVVDLLL